MNDRTSLTGWFRRIGQPSVWLLLAALLAGPAGSIAAQGNGVSDEDGGVFPERFTGEGAFLREAKWNDDPLPVNVRNQWGLINDVGDMILVPRFDWVDYMFDGLVRVELDGRTGFVNLEGDWVIDPIFRYADHYAEGWAIVGDGRLFGFLNRRGVQVVPYTYEAALRFREQRAAVMTEGLIGYLDRRGDIVIEPQFSRARSFFEGRAVVERVIDRTTTDLFYIDRMGEVVFDARAEGVTALGDFSDGLAAFERDGKWGFFNNDFEVVVEPIYDAAMKFESGLAAVKVGDQWGFIDKEGETAVEPQFEQVWSFTDVYAMVRVGREYGYIDRTGAFVIEPQFADAAPFFREVARVGQSPSFGYIDVKGEVLWDPRGAEVAIYDMRNIQTGGSRERVPMPRRGRAREAPYPAEWEYVPELPEPSARRRM
ncbi:MAG: WG repeat-containing protein [Planctomycetota bacterium]